MRLKVIKIDETYLEKWYKVSTFRQETSDRCDRLASRFGCAVEVRSPDGVVYKVFGPSYPAHPGIRV